jgi:hypothetical protein
MLFSGQPAHCWRPGCGPSALTAWGSWPSSCPGQTTWLMTLSLTARLYSKMTGEPVSSNPSESMRPMCLAFSEVIRHQHLLRIRPTDPFPGVREQWHVGFLTRVPDGHRQVALGAIVTPGDVTGDGRPEALGRDRAGKLWLYPWQRVLEEGVGRCSVQPHRTLDRRQTTRDLSRAPRTGRRMTSRSGRVDRRLGTTTRVDAPCNPRRRERAAS